MDLNLNHRKLVGTISVIVMFGLALWYFAIEPQMLKSQSYSGVVVDKYVKKRLRDWWKTRPSVRWCYLIVETDEGRRRKVEVPCWEFGFYHKGDRVIKEKGKRYPEVVRDDESEKRPRTMSLDEFKDLMNKARSRGD